MLMFSTQRGSVLIAIFGKDSSICWIFHCEMQRSSQSKQTKLHSHLRIKKPPQSLPYCVGGSMVLYASFLDQWAEKGTDKKGAYPRISSEVR